MKILHTADWHFGKQLYRHSLAEEMSLFTDWIIEKITTAKVDVLLISGDVFDVTNPSNADKEHYFSFLKSVRKLGVITIITGGNHDSISFLNSSKDYIKQDDIFVVGGATENLKDEIFHFKVKNEEIVICAVPFLRDKDVRHQSIDEQFESRHEAIQYGLQQHYQEVLKLAKSNFKNIPIIAMGHLFAIGSKASDSERDIHIGNSGAVSHTIFDGFDYVALGHIHKPQVIGGNEMIRYSGSPIPLSFSEKKDEKQVVIISVENGKITMPELIKVPKFRELLRFSGELNEIQQKMKSADLSTCKLPAYIELQINEMDYNVETIQQVNQFISDFNSENDAKIVSHKLTFARGSKNISELFEQGTSIESLTIQEVFKKRITSEFPDATTEQQEELITTFDELLDVFNQN